MSQEYEIIKKLSPNKMSRHGWKPDIIANHITEGSYTGSISWLCNPASGASAHFVISKTGIITQLVDIREAAWINGTRLKKEDSGPGWYGDAKLQLVRDRKTNANFYSVGIEHEGFYGQGRGKLTEAQFKATVWLHKYIIKEIKKIYGTDMIIDRDHIVGHYQIDPIRKPNCPGEAFQWDELINKLKTEGDDEEMSDTLKLKEQWQWDSLLENVKALREKGILNNTEWEEKIKNKTITAHELAWLNTIILKRLLEK